MKLIEEVQEYWEMEACGTETKVIGDAEKFSREWFSRIENFRYKWEPFIHSVAQFTRHRGKKILEVGVGAGTDHLQWARAGAECYGVDLTNTAIETTRKHLAIHGLQSNLQQVNSEQLPFPDNNFNVVYSWGVIHHSENPEKIIQEIRRVLKPGGLFIGMMYGRKSVWTLKLWIRNALLKGKPWKSFTNVLWNHMESVGTKAYTIAELKELFSGFKEFEAKPQITCSDTNKFPQWTRWWFPDMLGWFITLKVVK